MELSVPERPRLIYALVVRGQNVVLAEHTSLAGNFQQATMLIMRRLECTEEWRSYLYGEYAFHYIVDQATGLWFVCMAERAMGRRLPFAFLGELRELFGRLYTAEEIQAAIAYGMQAACQEELKALLEKYNCSGADRVTALIEKVQHINDSLMESIDKILERQERIELLVGRSDGLAGAASAFRREARRPAPGRCSAPAALALAAALLLTAAVAAALRGCAPGR